MLYFTYPPIQIDANDGAGTISIDPDSYFVNEAAGTVTITVVRTPLNATGEASVIYWTEDGTAESCETLLVPNPCTPASDGDFENIVEDAAPPLVFATGGSKTFDIKINPDLIAEPAEQFAVKIKQASGTSAVDTSPGDSLENGRLIYLMFFASAAQAPSYNA